MEKTDQHRVAIYGAGSLGTILGAYISAPDSLTFSLGSVSPTPLNKKVTALIHQIERGERKPGFDNLRYF